MAIENDLAEVRRLLRELSARVEALERASGIQRVPVAAVPPPPPLQVSPATKAPAPEVPLPSFAVAPKPKKDLESKIGGQWLNRIGIVAVLIGVSYFLKYAFENDWIGPAGRIVIGLLAGAAVIIWSEKFRSAGHRLFSFSLKAVGIGTLYLSFWGAFQIYHLISAAAAFAAMIMVTAFTVFMALRQDAQVIAAFAVAGGFSTPVLLSTGQNHEVVLFTYTALLDLAMLALIWYKPWKRLLAGALFGTIVLFAGWDLSYYHSDELGTTFAFATLFFLIFAAAPLITPDKRSRWHDGPSWTLIFVTFANALFYFGAIASMIDYLPWRDEQQSLAWAALGIAAAYILLSRAIQRGTDQKEAKTIALLQLALAVGFITTAIPLKLDAHWITIGWLVESAALLWLGEKRQTPLLVALGTAALALGVFRLLVFDNFRTAHLLWNSRFATYVVAIAILGGIIYFARQVAGREIVVNLASVALNLLALAALTYEIRDVFSREMQPFLNRPWTEWRHIEIVRDFSYSALYMAYGGALMAIGFWKKSAFLRWQALILLAFTIAKVFLYDVSALETVFRVLSFIVLGALLLAISYLYQRDWLKLSSTEAKPELAKGNSA